jgi:hypothetical protein
MAAQGSALLVVALVALAGCAGHAKSGTPGLRLGDGSTVDLSAAPASAGKGAIAGVVVDEAIRPIIGANVTVAGKVVATTDGTGVFVLDSLEPGVLIFSVSAPRFLAIQSSAEVAMGQTTRVRIQLPADNSPVPYRTTYSHDGFMQAWGGIGQFFVEEAVPTGSGLCDCRVYFTPDPNPVDLVYEAYWEQGIPDPAAQAEYYWVVEDVASGAGPADYCFSPCVNTVQFEGSGLHAGNNTYARLDGPDNWPAFQQKFQLFVTIWYNGPAPNGWTLAGEGA